MKANHNILLNKREGKISNDLIELKPGSILSKYNTENSVEKITKAQINQDTLEQSSIGMQQRSSTITDKRDENLASALVFDQSRSSILDDGKK